MLQWTQLPTASIAFPNHCRLQAKQRLRKGYPMANDRVLSILIHHLGEISRKLDTLPDLRKHAQQIDHSLKSLGQLAANTLVPPAEPDIDPERWAIDLLTDPKCQTADEKPVLSKIARKMGVHRNKLYTFPRFMAYFKQMTGSETPDAEMGGPE